METLFSFRYMRILVAVMLGVIIVAIAAAALNALNILTYDPYNPTINVEGVAEVTAVPDIGIFTFTVEAESLEVATAQEESGEKINAIMSYLEGAGGVAEVDIKTTNYNTYPRYEYETPEFCLNSFCERERVLRAYVVTQSVTVKVRDTSMAGQLIAEVGTRGATNLSGLSFEVDDLEGKKEEARLMAIADAKDKAKRLAKELDVRLGDIVSFNDNGGNYPVPYATTRSMGGEMMMDMAVEEVAPAFAPEISVGEDEITARVTITYELK